MTVFILIMSCVYSLVNTIVLYIVCTFWIYDPCFFEFGTLLPLMNDWLKYIKCLYLSWWICFPPVGTDFMTRLQEQLEYFVHNKLSTDKLWQNVRVYLSGHEVCSQLRFTLVWPVTALTHVCVFICRLQAKESTRSWSLSALRTTARVMTPTPDTVFMGWMLTW